MSLSQHFRHKCDIYRPEIVEGSRNTIETEFPPTPNLEQVMCRFSVKTRMIKSNEDTTFQMVTFYKLFLSANTDVKKIDQIRNITNNFGVVHSGPFEIIAPFPRRAETQRHIKLDLKEVS